MEDSPDFNLVEPSSLIKKPELKMEVKSNRT